MNPKIQANMIALPPANKEPSPSSFAGPLNFMKTKNKINKIATSQIAKSFAPSMAPIARPKKPHMNGILRMVTRDIRTGFERYTGISAFAI